MESPPPFSVKDDGFALRVTEQAWGSTVELAGELDLAARQSVVDAFDLASSAGGHICIDVTGVTFIDCAGLQALLTCREHSGRNALELTVAVGPVTRFFDLADVGHLFQLTNPR